jgi:hypothetical protein
LGHDRNPLKIGKKRRKKTGKFRAQKIFPESIEKSMKIFNRTLKYINCTVP